MGRKIICQFSSELAGIIKGVKVTEIHPAGTPAIISVVEQLLSVAKSQEILFG